MRAFSHYSERKGILRAELTKLESRSRVFSNLRLGVAITSLVFFGLSLWGSRTELFTVALLLSGAVFVVLVFLHARVTKERDHTECALRFYERGLKRLAGAYRELPNTGERFKAAGHPFSGDLDVFGAGSLFQSIDTTETTFGEAALARLLSETKSPPRTAFVATVCARQEAVRELSEKLTFREELSTRGALLGEKKPDPEPFVKWSEESSSSLPMPVVLLVRGLPIAFVTLLLLRSVLSVPRAAFFLVVAAELLLAALLRGRIARAAETISHRELSLARYGSLFTLIEKTQLASPRLVQLQKELAAGEGGITRTMADLSRLVSLLEARNNEVFRFILAPLLLWDENLVLSLERWRARSGKHARRWFLALGEIEALSSFASFAFEQEEFAYPTPSEEPVLLAKGMGHPLLPRAKRVVNDVSLEGLGHGLIVTGSNMSGKSTLLRAMGVNLVLAAAGAPVCAQAFSFGRFRVESSMRVADSLQDGVSHFYAEVKRLKAIVDSAREDAEEKGTVLFLLDEILHGTNSRERIAGARAILRELSQRGAVGAASTHDLGISGLEEELSGKLRNVHFEEQIEGDKMTFDYRLRPGVVRSSNALRLMKMVGIDVVEI